MRSERSMDCKEESSSAVFIAIAIFIVIAISAFAIWWHWDVISPSPDTVEVTSVPVSTDKEYLDNSLKELFNNNSMEVSSDELSNVPNTNDARELANSLTSIVNNNSSTSK